MKIELVRLVDGQRIEFLQDWDAKSLDIDIPGLEFKGPLKVRACVRRESGIIEADIDVSAPAELTCDRCLEKANIHGDKKFKLVYPVDLAADVIDLDDAIRQEIILGYPQKMLCRADCHGLCQRCGVNLNKKECKCKENLSIKQ